MQEFQNANLGSSKQFEKLQNDIQKIQAREAEAKENLLKALDKIEVLQVCQTFLQLQSSFCFLV